MMRHWIAFTKKQRRGKDKILSSPLVESAHSPMVTLPAAAAATRLHSSTMNARRTFQSAAEFASWMERIQKSAMPRPPEAVPASPAAVTPLLVSVDPLAETHYKVWHVPSDAATAVPHSPAASFREITLPLTCDHVVRTAVSDVGSWSTFRLSKFYELVDVLTGEVAYAYSQNTNNNQPDNKVNWVTAGHYHSRKLEPTDLTQDINMRAYPTKVGKTSMEIRTDVWQNKHLVNFCHTTMVALDPNTMRPLGADASLPPLQVNNDSQQQAERAALAAWHDEIRKQRAASTLQLRKAISTPPTPTEVQQVHDLHQRFVRMCEGPAPRAVRPRTVGEYTFRSNFVVFPENRNIHGKLFGGFVMSQAYNLALYAVKMFSQASRDDVHTVVPVGLDEAVFHQPVSVGDLISFTARVVHATKFTARVFVTVQVLDPTDQYRLPDRSNRLGFVFCAATPDTYCQQLLQNDQEHDGDGCFVLPNTYSEVLMQVEATRRFRVEGPSDAQAQSILAEAAVAAAASSAKPSS